MKKVLITGSAGSAGYETLKLLAKQDYLVVATDLYTKKNHEKLKKYQTKVNIVYGDITNAEFINQLVKENDIIIHLAAIIPPLADTNSKLAEKVNYIGTKNIVNAIKSLNPECFLIYSSSISVYGDRIEKDCITVEDELSPSFGDNYALTKINAEKYIEESGINYTIFRLAAIMDYPQLDPIMFHMPLNTKLEIATVEDTARAFVNACEHLDELNKRIFNLGGGEKCRTTYREFLKTMFDIAGLDFEKMNPEIFAEINFHCGFYKDGDELEKILKFRHDTLEDYYEKVRKKTNRFLRIFNVLFSSLIIYSISKKSEPLKAKKENDIDLIKRYFKK